MPALKRRMFRRLKRSRKPRINRRIKSVIRSVQMHDAEHKYATSVNTGTQVYYNTPLIDMISIASQGTSNSQRIGREINLASATIGFNLWRANTQVGYTWARVMVVKTICNMFGSAPTLSELLNYTANGQGYINSPHNPVFVNSKAYRVLYDKVFTFLPGKTGGGDTPANTTLLFPESYHRVVNINLHNSKADYQGTGAASSDGGAGHIWFLCWSDEASASTNAPYLTYNSLVKFTDC